AEICFDELGCYNNLPPWGGTNQRPATTLPWHPDEMGTRFLLFTQKNRYYQDIKMDKTIQASNYSGRRKTRFIIPGYLKKGDEDWPQEMCRDPKPDGPGTGEGGGAETEDPPSGAAREG
ncbi:inactive pancreatic lipase-related protein 1-like, partial [Plectropomus leopardus]|uniref:inactive pancreatic lipase-related protein 1-like n=1 Tax=Plectropomus leopardus TaxID=160734 RepID=UPI001C4C6D12